MKYRIWVFGMLGGIVKWRPVELDFESHASMLSYKTMIKSRRINGLSIPVAVERLN